VIVPTGNESTELSGVLRRAATIRPGADPTGPAVWEAEAGPTVHREPTDDASVVPLIAC
jgi:hypothetical protein